MKTYNQNREKQAGKKYVHAAQVLWKIFTLMKTGKR